VSPTTIIARTDFKSTLPMVSGILAVFWTRSADHHSCRFFRPRNPACQNHEQSGTLLMVNANALGSGGALRMSL
jgi:hypothetical protein